MIELDFENVGTFVLRWEVVINHFQACKFDNSNDTFFDTATMSTIEQHTIYHLQQINVETMTIFPGKRNMFRIWNTHIRQWK